MTHDVRPIEKPEARRAGGLLVVASPKPSIAETLAIVLTVVIMVAFLICLAWFVWWFVSGAGGDNSPSSPSSPYSDSCEQWNRDHPDMYTDPAQCVKDAEQLQKDVVDYLSE